MVSNILILLVHVPENQIHLMILLYRTPYPAPYQILHVTTIGSWIIYLLLVLWKLLKIDPKLNGYQKLFIELYIPLIVLKLTRLEQWYLDSVCSNHVTGNVYNFRITTEFVEVIWHFETTKNVSLPNMFNPVLLPTHQRCILFEGLRHNLLSISQLCDNSYKVIFKPNVCVIFHKNSDKTHFTTYVKENVYTINFICWLHKMFNALQHLKILVDYNIES